MTTLAIETSCDETSAAIVCDGRVCANVVSSQVNIHAEYGGVVPELATREHLRNLPPVTRQALSEARVAVNDLDLIAATRGPGLPSALLVGFKAAQALGFATRKPVVGIHHHEAHLYSPWMALDPPRADFGEFEPSVSLIVSGGHTLLVRVEGLFRHQLVGSTLDDAAGECFDKIGKLIGLPYPAGPAIDRLASGGRSDAFVFPRPHLKDPGLDFSFAGLKTSVRYFLEKNAPRLDDPAVLRDFCASVQAAIVEVLVEKTMRAARRFGARCVTASGGVVCNSALRRELAAECACRRLKLRLAPPEFSTDNAAMIGILAERKWISGGAEAALDEEIDPAWAL